jgi:hypothetical protein
MLSKAQEKELVNFCEHFKKSDDDVGLPQFLDLINSIIKLSDPELNALITNVDTRDPGAFGKEAAPQVNQPIGKPGDWDIGKYLRRV